MDSGALKDIGTRIRNLREEKNYTQDYLAQKLGITQKAYSKIEANQTRLPVDHLLKIAEVLETTVNTVLGVEGSTIYNNNHTHHGDGIVIHKEIPDKIVDLYERLLKAKEEEIALLKAQLGRQ